MARSLASASSQYLIKTGSIPVTSAPLTLAAYAKPASAHVGGILCLGKTSGGYPYERFVISCDIVYELDDPPFNFQAAGSNLFYSAIGGSYSVGNWYHVCGVAASSSSRTLYVDGTSVATNTSSVTPSSINSTLVGAYADPLATTQFHFNGSVLWPAIWNVALTDDEVASLAAGAHPLTIRPESLVFFAPLGGLDPEHDRDIVGGLSLTATNSPTWSDDSPTGLIYPSQQIIGVSQGIITPTVQHARLRIGV